MPDARLGPRVLRGVGLHLLGQFAVLAVNFLATPLLVHGLGTDGYALYTFLWTLCGYLILLNIGTSTTIQRYVAFYLGKQDLGALAAFLRRLLGFHLIMSVVGCLTLLAGKDWIIRTLLHAEGPVMAQAPIVLLLTAAAIPAYFLLQFGLNVLFGQQRFGIYNLLLALQSAAVAACAAVLLSLGKGLFEIAVVFLAVQILLAAAALWSIRSALALPSRPLNAKEDSEIATFSLKNFVNMLLWTVVFQGDRVFIGSMLPLTQLGFYVIPASLMQKFNMLSGAVAAATFPMIAELHGRGEEDRLRHLYLKSAELSLFFLLPLTIIVFVLAPQFLSLWLGAEFSHWGTWPLRLLLLANLGYFSTILPGNIATSKGHPEALTVLQLAKVAVLISCWIFLIPRLGIRGAAAGTLAAETLAAPAFLGYVHRRFLGISWGSFLSKTCQRPAIAGAALLALGLAFHARADTWLRMILLGFAGAAIYACVGYWLLDADAKALLSDWLRRRI